MESYTRVIPRDLFNEVKLLKCIGRLCLLIHDGYALNGMTFEHDGDPFDIWQLEDDGSLFIDNIEFSIKGRNPLFKCKYNSKNAYPLYCQHGDYYDYEDYHMFNDNGDYTPEFIEFCNHLNQS